MTTTAELDSFTRCPRCQRPSGRQIPPWITFRLEQAAGARITVISTGDQAVGRYQPNREYWHDNRLLLSEADLTFGQQSTKGYDEGRLDGLVHESPRSLECRRVVCPCEWTKDPYVPAAGAFRMFKTSDPDDKQHERSLAVLLEQDAKGRLSAVTWYKQLQPKLGLAWERPLTGPFTFVPGSSPTAIAEGDWYRFTQHDGS